MSSKLIAIRVPTRREREESGGCAEVVFDREREDGELVRVFGCKLHDSWEQWGAHHDILADNVFDIEVWRSGNARAV